MSGFEIAGVVLGSIPLLISGLHHYSKGLSTVENMRDYETVIENLVTSLSMSLIIFRTSCEQLLAPLMLPDEQFRELLANPQTDAWKDNELCEKLNERLGRAAYLSYKKAVKLLYKRIHLLKKKLDLNDNFQPKWISPNEAMDTKNRENFLKKTWRRMKIAIDADKYALLMAEIDRDITKISDLTKGNMALEPIRGERKRQANADFWTEIRDCSCRLFELLSSRFSPRCSCQHPHRANLRLDLRTDASVEQASIRFGFLFSFDENAQSISKLPWNWRHVEIEPQPETSITLPPCSTPSKKCRSKLCQTLSSRLLRVKSRLQLTNHHRHHHHSI
ncbi:hypothetical protein GJ744_010208 [Endocarpon pusillum]|uniref:Uncharacterized protein n=1 Tax=Endocarpon pusillum TaxID=364733 RepID=A0A8H7E3V0_9EURO|nr:hypothetical protein GJ744_010208 [Endocarpon pusillum]